MKTKEKKLKDRLVKIHTHTHRQRQDTCGQTDIKSY